MKYHWIEEYILSKVGINKDFKKEWNWNRYLLKDKMVAAICKDKEGKNIITLKCEPIFGEELRTRYEDIVEGYYMNKVHWNSVNLDGEVPDEILKVMIDQSYELIFRSLSKKVQREIGEYK
ncbi:putative DNA-binding protein (MmcQ/YjbR family) [Natranaerovirga pectinivora]|uniref:Putative DNA-binding protein (MmcQ/YjbR family) n=1 Tax=Natranaerovirga pectinivora TaxID=682400 RepID=A0A4R3MS34_9FIRM|nr:MmcQ/YjbR family DNA-binding protein [Natranaerovirga pectinivora]TCT15617.1 putative DNA-binding protein (MmcQ/YjbR family) [Natranaerovirga pectinivora]